MLTMIITTTMMSTTTTTTMTISTTSSAYRDFPVWHIHNAVMFRFLFLFYYYYYLYCIVRYFVQQIYHFLSICIQV